MSQDLWTKQGETLSHKNACKEFGLEEHEIIEAMRAGKLQYKENYAHGNPYFRLLRKEVMELALELRGSDYLEKQNIEYQLQEVTKKINSCKRKLRGFEKQKEKLIKNLNK